MRKTAAVLVILFLVGWSRILSGQVVLVREGDEWNFFRGLTAPPPEWNEPDFDPIEEGWESGATGIGYGDDDDVTILDDMQGVYVSVYLRVEIEVLEDLEDFIWVLRVRYDDGFVAYVDGEEVARRGLVGEPPFFDELASDHEITSPVGFDEDILLPDGSLLLTPGDHVLAVEVHNTNFDSSDLSFSAELAAAPFLLTSVEPSFGPVEGGDTVAIRGLGFELTETPEVRFGAVDSGDVEVVNSQLLRALVPPAAASGPVDVEVADSRGRAVLPAGYRYISPSQMGLHFGDDAATRDDEFVTASSPGDLEDEGTIEIWFQREGGGFFFFRRVLLAIGTPGADVFIIELGNNDVRATSFAGGEGFALTAGSPISTDVWYHLAFTYSPVGRRLYLDGELIGEDTYAMQLTGGVQMRVGDGFGNNRNFQGNVESVRVWNVERSSEEIRHFRYALFESEPGLESAWPLLEGGGLTSANVGPSGTDLIFGASPGAEPADPDWAVLEDFPTLAIAAVEPSVGSIEGGDTVLIYGKGFTTDPPTEVSFGQVASPSVGVVSEWELEVEVPPGQAFGSVDVSVQSGEGTVVVPDGYSYEPDEIHPLVSEGDIWYYFVGTFAPPSDWASLDFDPEDTGWGSGPTGIGYGDDDDATDVSQMMNTAATLYAWIEWELEGSPAGIDLLRLRLRFDDSYVVYLNGTEVARDLVAGRPPLFDELASGLHEITGGPGEFDVELDITFASDLLQSGRNALAIEVHNATLDSSDLSLSAELVYAGDLAPPGPVFTRGDIDGSGTITVTDCVRILRALFFGEGLDCEEAGDGNDDGRLDISDPIFLFDFVFRGGARPASPFPEPGPDLDDDALGCEVPGLVE